MKKRNLIIASIVTVVALSAAPFVVAAERSYHRGHGDAAMGGMMMFGHLAKMREALNLSDAQVEQIKAIHVALREQNAQYHESLKGGFGAVAQALLANPNDLATATALLDKQEQAERAMKINALTAASKALNVLTADQRAKASEMLAEHLSRPHREPQQ